MEPPVVGSPSRENASPIPEETAAAEDSQTLNFKIPEVVPPPPPPPEVVPPIVGTKRPRGETSGKVLTRNRIPFTSPKFDLRKYVSTVLLNTGSATLRPSEIGCTFTCDTEKCEYATKLSSISNPTPIGNFKFPVIGLLRLVFPTPGNPRTHHIVPYLVSGTMENPHVWIFEQYDTTFWWLFNVKDWYEKVGITITGKPVCTRAYIGAARAIMGTKMIRRVDQSKSTYLGYSVNLQQSTNSVSEETCVPWSMVILKYLINPKSIGLEVPEIDIKNPKQEDFNTMYAILNEKRDTVLEWVKGTIHYRGGKRRTRRRRQTRRKTIRYRK